MVVYILDDKILTTNLEGNLSGIDDKSFIDLKVINKETLSKTYNINNKSFGILTKANIKTKTEQQKNDRKLFLNIYYLAIKK